MKITGLHLFIILFGSLLLTYSLGTFMREGFTDTDKILDTTKLSPSAQQSSTTAHMLPPPPPIQTAPNATALGYPINSAGPYPSFSPASQTGPYPSFSPPTSQASSIGPYPSSMSKSITGKLTQMFDNVKNKLEGAVTDNNTNVYNYSQQRYDSYQGKAGDTVIVSPPPPQTIGLPSSSSPSPYPFPAPPPPPMNQNKNALGIPYSQIPQGQMDLYILKSEVIPPVCPACPNVTACASKEPPPPCPPCARCPEPAFECKKVPNYRGGDNNYLPLPVLADFSQFGM